MTAAMITGTQKAALLLIQFGNAAASRIMHQLNDEEIEQITTEIARLQHVDDETVASVLDEFLATSSRSPGFNQGGLTFARQLLEATIGRDRLRR